MIANRAGSVYVVGEGFFLFGGFKNPLFTAQKLHDLMSQWTSGPPLYRNESVSNQCLVQVMKCQTFKTHTIRLYLLDLQDVRLTYRLTCKTFIIFTCKLSLETSLGMTSG